jgi:hypothetical protein
MALLAKVGFRQPALNAGESSIVHGMVTRDAIMAELLEIEALLQDDRLNDDDRHALHGAQQALRNVLRPTHGIRHRRRSIASIIGPAKSSRF